MEPRKVQFTIPSVLPQLIKEFPDFPTLYISKLMNEIPEVRNIKSTLQSEISSINTISSPNWVSNYYKVFPCISNLNCKSPTCVYFHYTGEKRRSPKYYEYSPTLCSNLSKCLSLDNCKFAHNAQEVLFHPQIYKSVTCPYQSSVSQCPCKFLCPFLHNLSMEDRALEEFKRALKDLDDVERVANGVESKLNERLKEMGEAQRRVYCGCQEVVGYVRVPCGHFACLKCFKRECCCVCGSEGECFVLKGFN